jgi:excinuclease ABC subunit B
MLGQVGYSKGFENYTRHLAENEVRLRCLHSEIHSIERIEIMQDLRLGEYDVLVG